MAGIYSAYGSRTNGGSAPREWPRWRGFSSLGDRGIVARNLARRRSRVLKRPVPHDLAIGVLITVVLENPHMLDRSLETEFASYRKTLSTYEARRAFDERIERLLSLSMAWITCADMWTRSRTRHRSHVLTLPYDPVLALYFENRRFGFCFLQLRAAGY